MTDDARDTGDLAHAPADQRLDVDGGEGSDATAGGADDDLADVYADPSDVVEGDLA